MNDEKRKLLKEWHGQMKRRRRTQYLSAEHCRRMDVRLGVVVIVFSTAVGSGVFATLNTENDDVFWIKITLGLVAMISAVLAALQTFHRFSERAEQYQASNRTYNRLVREIEQLIAVPPKDEDLATVIDTLRHRIDQTNDEAPLALQHIWDRVRKEK